MFRETGNTNGIATGTDSEVPLPRYKQAAQNVIQQTEKSQRQSYDFWRDVVLFPITHGIQAYGWDRQEAKNAYDTLSRLCGGDISQNDKLLDSTLRSNEPKYPITPHHTLADSQRCYRIWRDGFVFLTSENRFVKLDGYRNIAPNAFATSNAELVDLVGRKEKRLPWTSRWAPDVESVKCEIRVMEPGEDRVTKAQNLNVWRPHPALTLAEKGNLDGEPAQLFQELVLHLSRDRQDMADHLLAWLAFGLFNPAERPLWAPVLISEEKGMGKDLFMRTAAALYGVEQCSTAGKLDKLIGQFDGSIAGKMLVNVSEAVVSGTKKFEAVEAIKAYITEPRLSMELKGKDPIEMDNHARFILASNHLDGFKVDSNERRFFIVNMASKSPMPSDFYERFANAITTEAGLASIAAFLESKVPPGLPNRAPQGDMDDLQDIFEPEWLKELKNQAMEIQGPVKWKAREIQNFAQRHGVERSSPQQVKQAMADAGFSTRRQNDGDYYTNLSQVASIGTAESIQVPEQT